MRYELREHDNGREYYAFDKVERIKVGFGALSFNNKTSAEILVGALNSVYLKGYNAAMKSAYEQMRRINGD